MFSSAKVTGKIGRDGPEKVMTVKTAFETFLTLQKAGGSDNAIYLATCNPIRQTLGFTPVKSVVKLTTVDLLHVTVDLKGITGTESDLRTLIVPASSRLFCQLQRTYTLLSAEALRSFQVAHVKLAWIGGNGKIFYAPITLVGKFPDEKAKLYYPATAHVLSPERDAYRANYNTVAATVCDGIGII